MFPRREIVFSFLKRHHNAISSRLVSCYSRKRASVDHEMINNYYDHREKSLEGVPEKNIFKYYETNLTDDPGKQKYIVRRKTKHPDRVMNSTKSSISIMFCENAERVIMPPYVCYKAKGLFQSWCTGGLPGSRYGRTKSGWFSSCTFEDGCFSLAPYLRKLEGTQSF